MHNWLGDLLKFPMYTHQANNTLAF